MLERSALQSKQAQAAGNFITGRRALFAALFAVSMAGLIALAVLALSPGGFQHNRYRADRFVHDHAALDGGWILERHNWLFDFAIFV